MPTTPRGGHGEAVNSGCFILENTMQTISAPVDFTARDMGSVVLFKPETPDAEVFDSAVPGEAQMIYYLISPRNACGEREPGIDPQGMPVLPLAACTPLGLDSDGDGHKDLVDNCATAGNPTQDDLDLDFVGDTCDNCPADWNPDQADADNDTLGDACDTTP